jgi:hypothetical protein
LGYSGKVRGIFEVKFYIGIGFIRKYIKGGGVSAKGKRVEGFFKK